jgi:hypothetical protein
MYVTFWESQQQVTWFISAIIYLLIIVHFPSYCNGFDQRIATQRLRKHVKTRNNGSCVSVDQYYSSLLGNSQSANELAAQILFFL